MHATEDAWLNRPTLFDDLARTDSPRRARGGGRAGRRRRGAPRAVKGRSPTRWRGPRKPSRLRCQTMSRSRWANSLSTRTACRDELCACGQVGNFAVDAGYLCACGPVRAPLKLGAVPRVALCRARRAANAGRSRAARESWTSSTRGRPGLFVVPPLRSGRDLPSQGLCSGEFQSCSAPRIRSGTIFGQLVADEWVTGTARYRVTLGCIMRGACAVASRRRARKSTTRTTGSLAESWRPLRSCRALKTSRRGCTGDCTATKIVQRGLGVNDAPVAFTCWRQSQCSPSAP